MGSHLQDERGVHGMHRDLFRPKCPPMIHHTSQISRLHPKWDNSVKSYEHLFQRDLKYQTPECKRERSYHALQDTFEDVQE